MKTIPANPPSRTLRVLAGGVVFVFISAQARVGRPQGENTDQPGVIEAEAMSSEAQAHYDEGLQRYRDQDYVAAIAAFEAALAVQLRPEVLFALAQAVRLSGDCPRAVILFDRFLATQPPRRQVEAATIARKLCSDKTPVIDPRSEAQPAPPPIEPVKSIRDSISVPLIFVGALGALTGGALMFWGHTRNATAREMAMASDRMVGDYHEARQGASRRVAWGVAALAVGGGLFAFGAGRYLWLRVDHQDAGTQMGLGGRF